MSDANVDGLAFREAIAHFATGVTVVTTTYEGRPAGMTASAVCSLSLDPVLLVVCIDNRLATHTAIEASRRFAVNVLGERDEELARRFARRAPRGGRRVGCRLGRRPRPLPRTRRRSWGATRCRCCSTGRLGRLATWEASSSTNPGERCRVCVHTGQLAGPPYARAPAAVNVATPGRTPARARRRGRACAHRSASVPRRTRSPRPAPSRRSPGDAGARTRRRSSRPGRARARRRSRW
jgi:Flavin reductase like domain